MSCQPFEHGVDASALVLRGDLRGAGTRGLAADVDQIGTGLLHRKGGVGRAAGIEELPAVGKRIRRDVQDAHEERPRAQYKRTPARQGDDVMRARGERCGQVEPG